MARALCILVSWIWGLWFGGIVLLFVAVQSLFNTFQDRRDVFAEQDRVLLEDGRQHRIRKPDDRQQQVLRADVVVAQLQGLVFGPLKQRLQQRFEVIALVRLARLDQH